MKKKIYLEPAIEVCMTEAEENLLAGSLTDVAIEGLDEDEISLGDDEGNIWEDAL